MKIRNKLLAAATIVALSGPAHADYFGELGFGIGESDFGTLDFTNPVGTAFTGSRVQGNNILLSNLDDSDDSSGGYVRAGYNLNDKTSLYISYRDFGEMATSGTALFSGVNFLQTLEADASALTLGASYKFSLSDGSYIAPFIEVGEADIDVSGTQGATGIFPDDDADDTAIAIGIDYVQELSMIPGSDLVVSVYNYDLGDVETGTTATAGNGMNAGEQLSSELKVLGLSIGLRFGF